MIIAKILHYMTDDEARNMNWKRMTREFELSAIDAYIDMQNNQTDKLSVCDMILNALNTDAQKHIHESEITSRLHFIRRMIEKGVYSPYREVERLTKENDVKDKQITDLMAQLEAAKDNGDELKEADLITKIVEHSVKLGVDVAKNVELVLGRIYRGTNKFAEHFKWLEDFIANTASSRDILKAIGELNETLKKGVEEGVTVINTGTYNKEVQEQKNFYPSLPSGQQTQKKLEDE